MPAGGEPLQQDGADERQDEQRHDLPQDDSDRLQERELRIGPYGGEEHRCHRHPHVAHQTERGHRRHIGAEHAPYRGSGHRRGHEGTHHGPLGEQRIHPTQYEIEQDAQRHLHRQQYPMKRPEPHLSGRHAAVGHEQHREDKVRGQKGEFVEKPWNTAPISMARGSAIVRRCWCDMLRNV